MKKFLLETRWIGVLTVAVFSLIVSYVAANQAALFVKSAAPTIMAEAQYFLPVTIVNGTIVEPKDTVIHKSYAVGKSATGEDMSVEVVLDTRTDELSADAINNQGLYFSRKYMYAVSRQKTEIRSLSDFPDMIIDSEMFEAGVKWLEANVNRYLFLAIFAGLLGFFAVAILLYSALSQLLLGKYVSADFSRTLRITTLAYIALTALVWFAGLSIGLIIKFVLILLANFGVNRICYPKPE